MKRVGVIFGVLICLMAYPLQAQVSDEEAKLIQDAWGLDKKEMIDQYMGLSGEAANSFWEVYDAYMIERKDLGMDRYQILKEYAENYDGLSGEKADELTERLFKNNMALEKLQLKCYKRMKKAVGPLEASKFIQAERYIESVIRIEVQSGIPFIDELQQIRG
ncbi:hypothetical protein [Robertkochia flava]|uniref:hypothetical protein n=1 Tax=Robertkochia flava TaxID=3447986 RepID=UPI001CC9096A|nr:hypothetical protein [Robertkochia marina]